jgi:hypothetical protein
MGGPPKAPVLVEHSKRLPAYIKERFPVEMIREQTDLVARHLRQLAGDLSYEML